MMAAPQASDAAFPRVSPRSASVDGLDFFCDFVEAPERAADAARRSPPVGYAVLAYVFAATSVFLAQALSGKAVLFFGVSWFSLVLACIWSLGTGLLMAAVVHLFAESLGGKGRVVPLFVLLGFSELPWALLLPGVLVLKALLPGQAWALRLLFMLIGLVTLVFKARSIRHNYRFGAIPAWVALLGPYAAVVVSCVLFAVAAAWGLVLAVVRMAS